MSFPVIGRKKITAAFDRERLTADGGVFLLAQAVNAENREIRGILHNKNDKSENKSIVGGDCLAAVDAWQVGASLRFEEQWPVGARSSERRVPT